MCRVVLDYPRLEIADHSIYMYMCVHLCIKGEYCISRNFLISFIFRRTSHSENIIIEHYVWLINFQKAENILNISLFGIILVEIFLIQKFHKMW